MTTFVYALKECGCPIVRYIGQSGYPQHRMVQHKQVALAAQQPTDFACWLKSADIECIELSEHPTATDARERERHLIGLFTSLGHPLFNIIGVSPVTPRRKPAAQAAAA